LEGHGDFPVEPVSRKKSSFSGSMPRAVHKTVLIGSQPVRLPRLPLVRVMPVVTAPLGARLASSNLILALPLKGKNMERRFTLSSFSALKSRLRASI
jgi:hypothetical protein